MLVSGKKILAKANKENYAVGAFNIYNMESLQAIIEAATRLKAPVIVQTTEKAINYAGLNYIMALIGAVKKVEIPFALHLDHGRSFEIIKKCVKAGYTSVMFDGSDLEFETNIKMTKRIIKYARKHNVNVEAELGELAGVEDHIDSSRFKYTNPDEAKEFVERTGCDSLAVSVGTSHGAYKFKGTPQLDIKRLRTIKRIVKIPLVLHGGSEIPQDLVTEAIRCGAQLVGAQGVPDSMAQLAIKNGINKLNIDSDIRLAFHVAAREFLVKNPEVFDPRTLFGASRKLVVDMIMHKIKIFGSAGKG